MPFSFWKRDKSKKTSESSVPKVTELRKPPKRFVQDPSSTHLIIDDSDLNRQILARYLDKFGCTSIQANNGKHALEKIASSMVSFDIIWVDISMPVMNGIEFTKKLRQTNSSQVIIGLTGHVDQATHRLCINAGMDTVLFKPVDRPQLLAYIRQYVSL